MAASALVPPLQLDASNIKPKQPAPPSLSSVTTKLVVFYSREGTTKKIGLKIAEHIHADVVEVVEDVKDESNAKKAKKGSPRGSGGLSFVKLCYRAKAKTTTPVTTKTPISLEGYDTLYIGSPVHVFAFLFFFPFLLYQFAKFYKGKSSCFSMSILVAGQ